MQESAIPRAITYEKLCNEKLASKMNDNIYIIIPAYNEEKSISKVILNLQSKGYHNIVVVDDGSKDKTGYNATQAGATVLRHIINRGQGASLRTGIEYAVLEKAQAIVTFDADGQHMAEDIKKMVTPILQDQCDITLGSRFLRKGSNVPLLKVIALKAGILFNWLVYGVRLTDAHNGFRALSLSAAKKIEITADKMEHASEILDEIRRKNLTYIEIPVTIRYTQYSMQKGQGPLKLIPLGFKMLFRKIIKKI